MPAALLDEWRIELEHLPVESATLERRTRIQIALDQGHGSSALADAAIADIVEETLLYFDTVRYRLHAWCIMPNHVHLLATPMTDWTLSAIIQTWKSYTGKKANALLGCEGKFWAPEYYDRAIRGENHYAAALSYIEMNPVKAGFCKRPEDWYRSSARVRERPD